MIKQSNLMKWAHNNKNNSKNGTNKSWIHPPDALQNGHVAYLVKFLGSIDVDQAKGIEVVKDGIRKLKFNQQLRKSEGTKTPKVEVTISIDGVAIQDPKNKQIFYQYPLHKISYCANDKSDKKFFSFIAKETGDKHMCFVFASEKLAEDITLTIGEAFDLAYRKFLDTSGRDLEAKKQLMILQKKVQELERENSLLKQKLAEYGNETFQNGNYKKRQAPANLLNLNGDTPVKRHQSAIETTIGLDSPASNQNALRNGNTKSVPPMSPSQELFDLVSLSNTPSVGTKLENLSLEDLDDFNPRADNVISNGNNGGALKTDMFGAAPFNPCQSDPFGMGDFNAISSHGMDLENAIGEIDKKISEMRDGFQRGISFGNDDFFDAGEIH